MQSLKRKRLLIMLILYHLTVLLWVYCMDSEASPGELPLNPGIELDNVSPCPFDEIPHPVLSLYGEAVEVSPVIREGMAPEATAFSPGLCCHRVHASP